MNDQELKIHDLKIVIKEKNLIINALVGNSESQTITNNVLLDRLIQQDTEINNLKLINEKM